MNQQLAESDSETETTIKNDWVFWTLVLGVFLANGLGDLLTTRWALSNGASETNPVMLTVIEAGLLTPTLLIGGSLLMLVPVLSYKVFGRATGISSGLAGTLLGAGILVNNTAVAMGATLF